MGESGWHVFFIDIRNKNVKVISKAIWVLKGLGRLWVLGNLSYRMGPKDLRVANREPDYPTHTLKSKTVKTQTNNLGRQLKNPHESAFRYNTVIP